MNEKISWYFEQKNNLLGENVLVICYKTDEKEEKQNGLTNRNILIMIRNNEFSKYINSRNFDLNECLYNSFKNKAVFFESTM